MSEIDDERLKEWKDMQELVGIAAGLNHGSNVTGKIKELERLADKLNSATWDRLRPSFLSWMNDVMIEKNQQRQKP
jgi:hypothetical protein